MTNDPFRHILAPEDPLCTGDPCLCLILRTARLQGPVRRIEHAPICWCRVCAPDTYADPARPL